MSDLVGVELNNKYYLHTFIDKGGMADVYKAWDKMKSTYMAIKILRRDMTTNSKLIKLFQEEAELLKTLAHPNIVRIYEFNKESTNNLVYIVMDWIDGASLKEIIDQRKSPFSLQEVSQILKPLSAALYFAHQMGFIHCDIKPANILIRKDGEVFLSDFGVARAVDDVMYGGTPWYMAYEQLVSGKVSPQTDVYSLAATVYEMLSGGVLPYPGNSGSVGTTMREKIKWEHDNLPLPSIQQYNRNIPNAVSTMLTAALSNNPRMRFADTTKMLEAFELACVRGGQRDSSVSETSFYPPPNKTALPEKLERSAPSYPKRNLRKPHIYCHSGDYMGQSIEIPFTGLRIGRGTQNALRISERSVSRWHAVIFMTAEGGYVRDENSSLGTLLNGQSIYPQVPTLLRHGDVIEIGYEQRFEYRER